MNRYLIHTISLFAAFLVWIPFSAALSAVPSTVTYQGQLLDAAGTPLTGIYPMVFLIYDDSLSGLPSHILWQESHSAVDVQKGLFTVVLGDGYPVRPIADSIFKSPNRWLAIRVGSADELMPRTHLCTVPYAYRVASIDSALSGTIIGGLTLKPNVGTPVIAVLNNPIDTFFQVNSVAGSKIKGSFFVDYKPASYEPTSGLKSLVLNSGAGETYGIYSAGNNSSIGNAFGGYFSVGYYGTGDHTGVYGEVKNSGSNNSYGMKSFSQNDGTGYSYGGYFYSNSNGSGTGQQVGVSGSADATSNSAMAVGVMGRGQNVGSSAAIGGSFTGGSYSSGTGLSIGVQATAIGSSSALTYGVYGTGQAQSTGPAYGGYGRGYGDGTGDHYGLFGQADVTGSAASYGGYFFGNGTGTGTSYGVYAKTSNTGSGVHYGVYVPSITGAGNYAAYFTGAVNVTGILSKGGGAFKIDHPLDPENKYLQHSFVESPDMKNIYDGTATLDAQGRASVELPAYFEALNKDFRYQLTCIGGYAPIYIAQKISGNRFVIAGGTPGLEVSWQVTGTRRDAFAEKNRIQVELPKPADQQGKYLHPEAFGLPAELGINFESDREVPPTEEVPTATDPANQEHSN